MLSGSFWSLSTKRVICLGFSHGLRGRELGDKTSNPQQGLNMRACNSAYPVVRAEVLFKLFPPLADWCSQEIIAHQPKVDRLIRSLFQPINLCLFLLWCAASWWKQSSNGFAADSNSNLPNRKRAMLLLCAHKFTDPRLVSQYYIYLICRSVPALSYYISAITFFRSKNKISYKRLLSQNSLKIS